MRLFIFSILQFTLLFSNDILNINSDKFEMQDFKIGYFINDKEKIELKDIQKIQFKEGSNSDSLGTDVRDTWIKISFLNSTQKTQKIFLHQDLAFTFRNLIYYEFDDKHNLIKKEEIDRKYKLYGADAVYNFYLLPKESKTIYIRQNTSVYHFYNFSVFSEKESIEYLVSQKAYGLFFCGLLLALAIYNLFIYISSKYKEYLYYSLYLFCATAWIFYMYGSLPHYFHIYGASAYRFNFALMFTPIFLSFFIQAIFETKTKYKTEHKFLNSIIILLFANFVYSLINFYHALGLLSLSLNYSMIIFLFVALSILKKKNKIVKVFLFAHFFYIAFNIYGLMFYLGKIEFNFISSHAIGIGIIIEAVILAYLVSFKFKIMEEEKEKLIKSKIKAIEEQNKAQRLLIEKSKLAAYEQYKSQILETKNEELINISNTDKLTNMYNRSKLEESLDSQINYLKRSKDTFGLILIDIDHFKEINDTFGHQIGDTVLVEFANILKSTIRETDIVGRWGGEEFMIICPETNLEGTKVLTKAIKKKIEEYEFTTVKSKTASFGITVSKKDDTKANLFNRADKALYEAKDKGRNTICIR